jgi:hypothetical protein
MKPELQPVLQPMRIDREERPKKKQTTMKLFFTFVALVGCAIGCCLSVLADDEGPEAAGEDSSAGLPGAYAKNYLIAHSTISPDKKFAVIYPTLESEEAAEDANHPERIEDYIVALQPFTVLGELQTKYPYFQNQNHGGISADWSNDNSVALITLDGKWGPHDVFLLEFRDAKLARTTNVLAKAHDLLLPDYRKSKAEPYNDNFDFIFDDEDGPVFKLDGANRVIIDGDATTDPKGISEHRWSAQLKALWNIAQAKFTEQEIIRSRTGRVTNTERRPVLTILTECSGHN